MDVSDLAYTAEAFLETYRELMLVDPFFRISIEVCEGDFVSYCEADSSPLSWLIRLNPSRHESIEDVQYSIVEGVMFVLFDSLDISTKEKFDKTKAGLVARLCTAISNLLPVEFANDDESNEEDGQ